MPQVTPPPVEAANEHIYHQYTIRAERRDELLAHLKAQGIGCAVYYPVALHLQPCFADLGYGHGSLPVTECAMAEVLSLPIYPELTEAQQGQVVDTIRRFYA
jgi:dTDP-4-amino-4,6-dideoxygalactose transaminase